MENKLKKLKEVLNRLKNVDGINNCLIVTKDGILLVSCGERETKDPETVAAMSATIFGAARATAREIGSSDVDHVVVHTNKDTILVNEAGEKLILVSILKRDFDVAVINHETRKAADKISEIYL